MHQVRHICIRVVVLLMAIPYSSGAFSQTVTNDFQTRTELKLSYKPLDQFTLSLTPEVRMDESFQVNKFLLESKFTYEPLKGLSLGAGYRFIINPRTSKATEYLHRFALDASYKRKIERFEPALRIKYTNFTEDMYLGEFLRYRAKLEYDIKNCKITPLASAEAFHYISENQIYKMRYGIGAQYKLNKRNRLELGYMLDYYMLDQRNKHIINLGYKFKF